MCSIGEDDYGDEGGLHAMVPGAVAVENDPQGICNKCGHSGSVYKLSFRAAECRDCFLAYVRHKFRATLGSSKLLPRDAEVLLVFDGSPEAVVLLDMLHHAQTQNQHKRIHCTVRLLYIDDMPLLRMNRQSNEKYTERISDLRDFLWHYKHFTYFIWPIGSNATTPPFSFQDMDAYLKRDLKQENDFINSVASIGSLTSRQDFVKHHRSRLIAEAAKYFNCGFAFLSDISTTLASELLTAVTLGRGSSAALDVALVDDRFGEDVKLVRPIKDLNETEVQLYLRAQQLSEWQSEVYGAPQGSVASLQNLTKAFVDNLQQNFSATVSTVFRTGDKIAPNRQLASQMSALTITNNEQPKASCVFCNSPLDYADSTTLLAIEFSRIVSEAGTSSETCMNMEKSARKNLLGEEDKRLRSLCHGCRNIHSDSGGKALQID